MAESTGLLEGLLRMLCANMPEEVGYPIVRGTSTLRVDAGARMSPMEKATLLEALPAFCQLSRAEMLSLTQIASEVSVAAGCQIFTESDPPTLHLVVSGSVSLESTDDESLLIAVAGDAIGLYQMLAGIPLVRHGREVTAGRAEAIWKGWLAAAAAQQSAIPP